ncbi:MAG: lipocalin-like domain-containing protein [Vicinamibacteria bacterium]
MGKNHLLALAFVLACGSAAAAEPKTAKDFVGTWTLVAADKLLPDGTRIEDYGPGPHGLAIFTADGRYSVSIYRADRRKFASNDKLTGTPEEYRDVSLGMSAHFGRYTVDGAKGVVTLEIDRASYPNWDGASRATPFEIVGDELTWKVPPRPDGSIPISTFRRVK